MHPTKGHQKALKGLTLIKPQTGEKSLAYEVLYQCLLKTPALAAPPPNCALLLRTCYMFNSEVKHENCDLMENLLETSYFVL